MSFGSGAGPTEVVSPFPVELGGIEVADGGGWDDASADCSVSVEVAIETVGTVLDASPSEFVDVR